MRYLSYLLIKTGVEKLNQTFDKNHDFKVDLGKFTIDTVNQFDKLIINKINILPEDNLEKDLQQFLAK